MTRGVTFYLSSGKILNFDGNPDMRIKICLLDPAAFFQSFSIVFFLTLKNISASNKIRRNFHFGTRGFSFQSYVKTSQSPLLR